MDRKKTDNKNGDHQKWVMPVSGKFIVRPRDQFLHQTRRVERWGRFKDHPDTSSVLVEGLDVIGNLLVLTSMVFVPWEKPQQGSVQLLDVVLGQRNIAPGIEHQRGRFGVA